MLGPPNAFGPRDDGYRAAPVVAVSTAPVPQSTPQDAEAPWVKIYRVLVDDFPLLVRDGERVAPPLGRRNVQFRYGVAGVSSSDSVLYRFRMEGLDRGWVFGESIESAKWWVCVARNCQGSRLG
ncbi:MAG: hypothetical protein R3362_11580 [Rhodothermales bacterium]|nr:hypothetical protein [Rhodothermales bacterium]